MEYIKLLKVTIIDIDGINSLSKLSLENSVIKLLWVLTLYDSAFKDYSRTSVIRTCMGPRKVFELTMYVRAIRGNDYKEI